MKKILIYGIVFLMIIGGVCFAQQIYVGRYHPIKWDLVEPIPSQVIQTYEHCVLNRIGSNQAENIIETDMPPVTVDISSCDYVVIFGVRTVWTFIEEMEIDEIIYPVESRKVSNWTFSDSTDPEYVPIPFDLLQDVLAPKGVRRQ